MTTIPTIGRIVLYTLTKYNADTQNKCRADAVSSSSGSQLHSGNAVSEGEVFPMIITRVWGTTEESAVNGQVFLDGNDQLWVTSTAVGEGPGTFSWPVISKPQENVPVKSAQEPPKSVPAKTATVTEPTKTTSEKTSTTKTASAKPPQKSAAPTHTKYNKSKG